MPDDADVPTGIAEIEVDTPTERERAALERVRWVSGLLDDAVRIPGTDYRVGVDPLLSVVPVIGDAAGALVSAYVILEAILLGVPRRLVARMALNVAIDFVGGSLPVLGTVFDAVWKANRKNVALLERHIEGA